jgi:hypothetical protein
MLITLPKENTEITLVLGTILKENTLNWLSSQLGALSSRENTPEELKNGGRLPVNEKNCYELWCEGKVIGGLRADLWGN